MQREGKKKKERERNDYRVSSERWFGRPLSFLNNHLLYSSAGNRAQPEPPNKTNFKEDLLSWFCFFESFFILACSKRTYFFHYLTLLQLLSSQSFSNALFSSCLYEAPPSEKHTVLWLVGWMSVLWLVNYFECVSEMCSVGEATLKL